MISRQWWDEDLEKKDEERVGKEVEIETLEDAIWNIRLMRNSCCDKCRSACDRCLSALDTLVSRNRQEQESNQYFEYEESE